MSCVLTLVLDEVSQERFEALRQQHFPPGLNRIPAHLSLFHTLPESDEVDRALAKAAGARGCFPMRVAEVRSLGKGVAFFIESAELRALHRTLSEVFEEHLTAQDRQGFRAHVVAQNKVTPERAKATLALVQAGFQPWTCQAVGLDLWRYLGGPWLHLQRFRFRI